jgi:hypothetical protein
MPVSSSPLLKPGSQVALIRELLRLQAHVEKAVELGGWMICRDRLKKQDGSLPPLDALQRLVSCWPEHPCRMAPGVTIGSADRVQQLRGLLPADAMAAIDAGEGAFRLEIIRCARQTFEQQGAAADEAITQGRRRLKEAEQTARDEETRLRSEQQKADQQVTAWNNEKRKAEAAALALRPVQTELAYCVGLKNATGFWATLTGRKKRIGQISLQVCQVVQQVRRALPDPPPLSLYFPRNGEGKCTGTFLSFPVDYQADLARLKNEIPGWLKDARTRLAARVEESNGHIDQWREVKRKAGRAIEERKQAAKRERQQLSEEEKKQTEQRDRARGIVEFLKRFEDEVPSHGFFPGKDIVAIAVLGDSPGFDGGQADFVIDSPKTAFCYAGLTDDPIALRSLDLVQREALPGHAGGIVGLALSPSGLWMASAGLDGGVGLWSLPPPALCRRVAVGAPAYAVTFGDYWLFAGTNDKIVVYSLPDLHCVDTLDVEGMVWGLAYDRGRKRLFAITASFEEPLSTAVWVWDMRDAEPSFELRRRLRGFGGLGTSLACDPKGRWLAAGEGCGSPQAPEPSRVLVWDATTLRLKRVFTCHSGWVEAVAFSPDGRWLLSGDGAGPIGKPTPSALFMHDVEANRTALSLGAHAGWVRSLAFDPRGQLLFTGGSDGVWAWDFLRLTATHGRDG